MYLTALPPVSAFLRIDHAGPVNLAELLPSDYDWQLYDSKRHFDERAFRISELDPEVICLLSPLLPGEEISPRTRIKRLSEMYPRHIRLDPWFLQALWKNMAHIPIAWTQLANTHDVPVRVLFEGFELYRMSNVCNRAVLSLLCFPSPLSRRIPRRFKIEAIPVDQPLTSDPCSGISLSAAVYLGED
jgi:hypothetical protein